MKRSVLNTMKKYREGGKKQSRAKNYYYSINIRTLKKMHILPYYSLFVVLYVINISIQFFLN